MGFDTFSVASYRPVGQRGRPSFALVRKGHLSPRAALSRAVGPLAEFSLPGWTEPPAFDPILDDPAPPIGPSPWMGRSALRAALRAAAVAEEPGVAA